MKVRLGAHTAVLSLLCDRNLIKQNRVRRPRLACRRASQAASQRQRAWRGRPRQAPRRPLVPPKVCCPAAQLPALVMRLVRSASTQDRRSTLTPSHALTLDLQPRPAGASLGMAGIVARPLRQPMQGRERRALLQRVKKLRRPAASAGEGAGAGARVPARQWSRRQWPARGAGTLREGCRGPRALRRMHRQRRLRVLCQVAHRIPSPSGKLQTQAKALGGKWQMGRQPRRRQCSCALVGLCRAP